MAGVRFTKALREEYRRLFDTLSIDPSKQNIVESIIKKILKGKSRYKNVSGTVGIPWYFIAVVHNMESSLNFNKHLHNGDPLTDRTKHVPAGRPKNGEPPFTWEESAVDSLKFQRLDKWNDWTLPGILYKLEGYNGFGYRRSHPHVLTPYLWSFSNHYISGKYVADGRFSETAVSQQCGAAVILRRMAEKSEIEFEGEIKKKDEPEIVINSRDIPKAKDLQMFLNTFPGIYLKVDGKPGIKTSEALRKVLGTYLKGDKRKN